MEVNNKKTRNKSNFKTLSTGSNNTKFITTENAKLVYTSRVVISSINTDTNVQTFL